MFKFYRILVLAGGILVFFSNALTFAQGVELQVIQKFEQRSVGHWGQVKFADMDGDGDEDMVARYSKDGFVIGIWLYQTDSQKFSDSVDCTIDLGYTSKTCWFNVGDLNSDGKADVAIMSQYNLNHPPKLVWGRESFPALITASDLDCSYPVDADYQQTGQYTSVTIGDFNGDGDMDLVFPDQGTKLSTGNYGGRAVIYFGGADIDGDPDLVLNLPGTDEEVAISDSTHIFLRWFSPFMDSGDFNGDGNTDIFAGGFYSSTNIKLISAVTGQEQEAWNSGAGIIFLGGSDLDDVPDIVMIAPDEFLQFTSPNDFLYLGYCVYNAGDYDGDGTDDISLPSWYWGINFVYKGNRGYMQAPTIFQTRILRTPEFYYTKDRYNSLGYSDQFGPNLVPIGDINNDGTPDLGNTKNFFGNGPLTPGIRLFFITPEKSDAIEWDYETSDYIAIHPSNKDFDGDGVADILAFDQNSKLNILKVVITTDVEKDPIGIVDKYMLNQNYPNPFNPSTTIDYSLSEKSIVNLNVYNNRGELVQNVVSGIKNAGNHSAIFNGAHLPSGIYFYQLTAGKFRATKKFILIK